MRVEELRVVMDELALPYDRELMTTWEQTFYEDLLEKMADVDYRFSYKQLARVEAMREKYDLDIKHGEAMR